MSRSERRPDIPPETLRRMLGKRGSLSMDWRVFQQAQDPEGAERARQVEEDRKIKNRNPQETETPSFRRENTK